MLLGVVLFLFPLGRGGKLHFLGLSETSGPTSQTTRALKRRRSMSTLTHALAISRRRIGGDGTVSASVSQSYRERGLYFPIFFWESSYGSSSFLPYAEEKVNVATVCHNTSITDSSRTLQTERARWHCIVTCSRPLENDFIHTFQSKV